MSDTPLRAKPPAFSGPGRTSEALTACQQPPNSPLLYTCVCTTWRTSLLHGSREVQGHLQSVPPARGGSSPCQPPPHLPPASDTLWGLAPSWWAGTCPSQTPWALLSPFSLAPSLCCLSITFLVICCSGLTSAMVYVTPALPCKASSSGTFIASLFNLPFLLIGDLFSSGLDLSRCEMDHNLHSPQPHLTMAASLPDQVMETTTTLVLALTSPLCRHCRGPPWAPGGPFTSCCWYCG